MVRFLTCSWLLVVAACRTQDVDPADLDGPARLAHYAQRIQAGDADVIEVVQANPKGTTGFPLTPDDFDGSGPEGRAEVLRDCSEYASDIAAALEATRAEVTDEPTPVHWAIYLYTSDRTLVGSIYLDRRAARGVVDRVA